VAKPNWVQKQYIQDTGMYLSPVTVQLLGVRTLWRLTAAGWDVTVTTCQSAATAFNDRGISRATEPIGSASSATATTSPARRLVHGVTAVVLFFLPHHSHDSYKMAERPTVTVTHFCWALPHHGIYIRTSLCCRHLSIFLPLFSELIAVRYKIRTWSFSTSAYR